MPLLAYNKTGSPVTLAAGSPAPTLPASAAPPSKGKPYDVTSELRPNLTVDPVNGKTGGLTGANFVAIQAQVTAGSVAFEWTSDPEYLTTGLTVPGPAPAPHAHTVDSTTATNNTTTATNQGATATNQNTASAQLVDLGAPDAPDTDAVHALFSGNDASNDFPGPFTNPDVSRSLSVAFEAGWDGGNVTVSGTDQFDVVVSEVFVANPGNTVQGTKIFKTTTGATKGAVGANAAGASIGIGQILGLPTFTQPYGMLTVDGVAEAGTFETTYYSVTPTSAPNGAKVFLALVTRNHTHIQDAHNHTQDAHGHTQSGHTHTLS